MRMFIAALLVGIPLVADAAPAIDVPFDQDVVPRGSSYMVPIQIRNDGAAPRTITRIAFDNVAEFKISDRTGTTLAPGASIEAFVTYRAKTVGSHTGTLTVDFDQDGSASHVFTDRVISRTFRVETEPGRERGYAEYGDVNYGSVARRRTITVIDQGIGAATIQCDAIGDLGDGFTLVSPCPQTLPAGGSVSFEVEFDATEEEGIHAAALPLRFPTNDVVSIGLYARVFDPGFVANAEKVVFPRIRVGETARQFLEIENLRDSPIDIAATIEGDGLSFVGTSPIHVDGTVRLEIVYAPTQRGTVRGVLKLGDPSKPYYREVPVNASARP